MLVNDFEKCTSFRDEHRLNAKPDIRVIPSGIEIEVRELQSENALPPIDCTLCGILMFDNDLQLANA